MERLRLSGIPVSPGLFDEVVSIPIDHEAIPPHIAATVIVVPNVLCRGNGAVGSVWRLLFPESRRSAVFHFQADAAHLCCAPSHVNMNGWELSVTENLNGGLEGRWISAAITGRRRSGALRLETISTRFCTGRNSCIEKIPTSDRRVGSYSRMYRSHISFSVEPTRARPLDLQALMPRISRLRWPLGEVWIGLSRLTHPFASSNWIT